MIKDRDSPSGLSKKAAIPVYRERRKAGFMDKYIEGNKEAWEEAFDNRDASWGADITDRIRN